MRIPVESNDRRYDRLTNWHRWFAWRPVRVNDDELAWLEVVERSGYCRYSGYDGAGHHFKWEWAYRFPEGKDGGAG